MTKTPECNRWSKVHSKAVLLNEFFDFLSSKHLILCEPNKLELTDFPYYPTLQNRNDLIYEFFGIDFDKLESERRELLRSIQH